MAQDSRRVRNLDLGRVKQSRSRAIAHQASLILGEGECHRGKPERAALPRCTTAGSYRQVGICHQSRHMRSLHMAIKAQPCAGLLDFVQRRVLLADHDIHC